MGLKRRIERNSGFCVTRGTYMRFYLWKNVLEINEASIKGALRKSKMGANIMKNK